MWYYKDWLSDKKLQRASVSTRGIWANILMYMYDDDGDNKGTIEDLTLREISNLGGASEAETKLFIKEAEKLKFCDICVTRHGVSYIRSRRITRDDKERIKARNRKRNQRNKEKVTEDVTDMSQESHTPLPVPVPVPTSNEVIKKPTAAKFKPLKKPSEIDKICDELFDKKIFAKVHSWKDKMTKDGQNKKAILHTLNQCLKKRKFKTTPWAYCTKIIQVENGNYNEAESINTHEGFKSQTFDEEFKKIADGLTKKM